LDLIPLQLVAEPRLSTNPRRRSVWLLGNLARATYVGSSEFVWPFSYNKCDPKSRMSQEINACSKVNHFGMKPGRGRGAPEIDVLEAMQGDTSKLPSTHVTRPYVSCSLQVRRMLRTIHLMRG
jgi:hypothetical protein